MIVTFEKSNQNFYVYCYFCDQNYFVIFALLGRISKLILLSLVAKSNQKFCAVLKNAKVY